MTGPTPFDREERTIRHASEHHRHTTARRPPMLAILGCVLAALGYTLDASRAATPAWDSPQALGLAALACIALHLAGIGPRRP